MMRVLTLSIMLAGAPCVSAAADFDTVAPVSPGLWRGHFSGGLNYDPQAQDIALAWTDRVQFFPDDVSCRRWLRILTTQFAPYQGFTGCLRIR